MRIVPNGYVIGMNQLPDALHGLKHDPKDLDVRVRVGWVKSLNCLCFLYEAYDNYWDFSRLDPHNDMFELGVSADFSGGPLIRDPHPTSIRGRSIARSRAFTRRTGASSRRPAIRIGRW